jgi:hypothetical protein
MDWHSLENGKEQERMSASIEECRQNVIDIRAVIAEMSEGMRSEVMQARDVLALAVHRQPLMAVALALVAVEIELESWEEEAGRNKQ